MPSEWIVDPASIDFNQRIFSKQDVLEYCKQRGSFELVDAVSLFEGPDERDIIVGYKDLAGEDWWANDHIPGRPIFPGVLMVEACGQLCTFHYLKSRDGDSNVFIGYGGLDNTRFRGIVEPPTRFVMAGKVKRARSKMFVYFAQGFADNRMVFETDIIGVII